MLEAALPFAAMVLVAALLPRLRDLRPGANRGRRALTIVLVALLVSVLSAAPSVGPRLSAALSLPHADLLVGRVAIVAGAFFTMRGFTNAYGSRGIFLPNRLDLGLVTLVLLVMTGSFLAARLSPDGDPLVDAAQRPTLTPFSLAFSAYLGWACVGIMAGWRTWRHQVVGPVRTGLRWTTFAAVSGLLYALGRCTGEVLLLVGAEQSAQEMVRQSCIGIGLVTVGFVILGTCWAPVSAGLPRAVADVVRRWRLVQLYPLWRDVVTAVPDVRLADSPRRRVGLFSRNARWVLYRRVIEILDGQARLEREADRNGTIVHVLHQVIAAAEPGDLTVRSDVDDEAARLAAFSRRYAQARSAGRTSDGELSAR